MHDTICSHLKCTERTYEILNQHEEESTYESYEETPHFYPDPNYRYEKLSIRHNSRIQYIHISNYIILPNTDSSINLIKPKFVNTHLRSGSKIKETFSFTTANGKSKGSEFVYLKING